MTLEAVSVSGNGPWQLNRPMLFTFSADVDFSTVNMNTIHIGQTAGGPALGEFVLVDPRTVKFQPRCPTLPDYSDAGLLPGGVSYTIQIPGSGSGAATVRSTGGAALGESLTIPFHTVSSNDPASLFIDTALGPPSPVIRTDASVTDATYIEIGHDPANRVYFEPRPTPDPERGAKTPDGFTSGLNLYSDISTHLAILVAINQAVGASEVNVNPDNVRLEYRDVSGVWHSLAHTVTLEANCLGTGALLRVTPTGILPQNHLVRVLLTRDFEDLVGDANLVALAVGTFLVTTATDPGDTAPSLASDEILEDFTVGGDSPGSLEDSTSVGADPPADWGTDGLLKAGFAFEGTGGPDHNFFWKIGNDEPLSQSNHPVVLLDTSFSVIFNQDQSQSQTVVNGIVDVKDLLITASGTLSIQGPNPCTIYVAGTAQIDGEIMLKGTNNLSVATLNTTNQPEPGASGRAGGGRGGTGSYLTTQSTRQGGNGFGAFDTADGGGVGGESAFNQDPADFDDGNRRPAGGGGGTLGHNFLRPIGIVNGFTNPNLCPDQIVVGYDAEQGFSGAPTATGAVTGQIPPVGGAAGPRPFFNEDPNDDFWGTMLDQANGQLIQGELQRPWAGAGGGAGGDAIVSTSFPTTPFDIGGDEKGSGGGGAGGGLTIYALGDIRFGPRGRINASGGTGGGGENSFATGDVTHIGGGSGGGSGGHIILQTASQIDMSAVITDITTGQPAGGVYALGGNGGAGKNDLGGAHPGGFPTSPNLDALPPNSYSPPDPVPCPVDTSAASGGYPFTNSVGINPDVNPATGARLVSVCAGGDGGPGLIQFHTAQLSDIVVPTTSGNSIYNTVRPPPVGSFPGSGAPVYSTVNDPSQWNQMLPIFGRRSQAISKWIPLGAASVPSSGSATPDPVEFYFRGTSASGAIQAPGGEVAELTPILTGTIVDEDTPPAYPYVDRTDQRTIVFDGTTLVDADDIYLRNTALLKRSLLRLTHGTEITEFSVAFASYEPVSGALRLTVDAGGQPLGGVQAGYEVEVRPRFFRVQTNGVDDALPATSEIVAEFQATVPNSQGDPDLGAVSAWTPDISAIDPNQGGNPDYKFFRFRISFDISVNDDPLTFDTPIPALDYFRIPFKF